MSTSSQRYEASTNAGLLNCAYGMIKYAPRNPQSLQRIGQPILHYRSRTPRLQRGQSALFAVVDGYRCEVDLLVKGNPLEDSAVDADSF